ncbi:hypothetical protein HY373_01210 [Candidatus Berkelbacteria bacterium]|nr:hypothetical protein [Candidatus Berkelbacteria bacterium]
MSIQKASHLLLLVGEVELPAISPFDAGAHFVVTPDKEGENAEPVFGWLGDDVRRLVEGSMETGVAETTLRVHMLKKPSVDSLIIAELGGEKVVTTTWGQMYEVMKRQGHDQPDDLLTDGCTNIFYIRCSDGAIRAVGCRWRSYFGYWHVYANPITDPSGWLDGNRVVSRCLEI